MLAGAFIWPLVSLAPVPSKMAETLKVKINDTFLSKYQSLYINYVVDLHTECAVLLISQIDQKYQPACSEHYFLARINTFNM
jgi:hypothetical protein